MLKCSVPNLDTMKLSLDKALIPQERSVGGVICYSPQGSTVQFLAAIISNILGLNALQ